MLEQNELELKILPFQLDCLRFKRFRSGMDKSITKKKGIKIPYTEPQITSSAYGKIKEIVLTCSLSEDDSRYIKYTEQCEELVRRMDDSERTFYIVLNKKAQNIDAIKAKFKAASVKSKLRFIESDHPLDAWIQDDFLAVHALNSKGEPYTYLVEPKNEYPLNIHVAEAMAKEEQNIEQLKAEIKFVGGNVLVGDDFVLIGIENESYDRELIQQYFGKTPIFIGKKGVSRNPDRNPDFIYSKESTQETDERVVNNEYQGVSEDQLQPIYHLDVFITIAGKIIEDGEEKNLLVIGEPVLGARVPYKHIIESYVKQIITKSRKTINNVIKVLESFEDIKFKIVRNPLPLTYGDSYNKKERTWFWATYNNCLVEITDDAKRVWLPSYGIKSNYCDCDSASSRKKYGDWTELHSYDVMNKWIWESLGIEVMLLEEDYIPFAASRGALNCITNCIKR